MQQRIIPECFLLTNHVFPINRANREDVLQNEVSASLALASLNEALYDQLVALADLERTTAGGVRVNFPGR